MEILRVLRTLNALRSRRRAATDSRVIRLLIVGGLLLLGAAGTRLSAQVVGEAARGETIYLEGLLHGGKPLRAVVEGDVEIEGGQLFCESCHQRSGLGTSEAGALVPRVTRQSLYEPRTWRRADMLRKLYQEQQPKAYWSRVRDPLTRPAYTDETLAAAIRDGIDSSGRQLDPMMPRYALDEADMDDLIAFLKTLENRSDPGVDERYIHFATVVTPGGRSDEEEAVLDVLTAYVERKNRWVINESQRRGHSPHYKDLYQPSFREWSLHVWRLTGPAEAWPEQLEAYYLEQPVFAVLGGLGPGSWRPIHDFCAGAAVPCLFPITDLPVADSEDLWSIYFSRGMALEGEVVAHSLKQTERVLVVVGEDPRAAVAADALSSALDGLAVVETTRPDELMSPQQDDDATPWVLWLTAAEMERLAANLSADRLPAEIYLSATLTGDDPAAIPEIMRRRALWVWPWAQADERVGELRRIRAWLLSRGLEPRHERLQLQIYFTLSLVDHAMMHLVDNFSRDFFLEEVEHEAEQEINQAAYPHLGLGPGQRFASKGAYIVRTGQGEDGAAVQPGAEWIVP